MNLESKLIANYKKKKKNIETYLVQLPTESNLEHRVRGQLFPLFGYMIT